MVNQKDLLRRSSISYFTLFKYSSLGLIPHPQRVWKGRKGSDSLYPDDAVDIIKRIKTGQKSGLTLRQIAKKWHSENVNFASTEPIKIGFFMDATSFLATTDPGCLPGAQFAIAEIGSEINGRPIELIIEDTASNPKRAMEKARKLVKRDGITVLVGPMTSGVAETVAPYATKNKIPVIPTYAFHLSLAQQDNWFYFPIGINSMFGYASGVFAAEELGAKTAAALGLDFAGPRQYIEGFKDAFEGRGGKVIQQQCFAVDEVDFSKIILNVPQDADILALAIFGTADVPFFRQYTELTPDGKRPIVSCWDEFDLDINRKLGIIPAEIPVYTTSAFAFISPEAKTDFEARYIEIYRIPPKDNALVQLGYLAMKIALEALKKTGGKGGDALNEAIENLDIDTVHGRIKFTDRLLPPYVEVRKIIAKGEDYDWEPMKKYRIHGEWNADRSAIVKSVIAQEASYQLRQVDAVRLAGVK